MTTNIERVLDPVLHFAPGGQEQPSRYVECFAFGFTPADALGIAQLVLNGTKTATGSVFWSYDADKKPLPIAGECLDRDCWQRCPRVHHPNDGSPDYSV